MRRSLLAGAPFIMMLLLISALLVGCNSNVDTEAGDSIVTGFISGLSTDYGDRISLGGQITDASTGKPIQGAGVGFDGVPEVYTNSNGIYSMAGINLASLVTSSSSSTSTSTTQALSLKITLAAQAQGYVAQSRGLTISAGTSVTQNFMLTPVEPASVQGLVTGYDTGAGLAGVRVTVDENLSVYSDSAGDGITGSFRFQNLTAGFHYFGFQLDGYVEKVLGVTLESGANKVEVTMSPVTGETATVTGMVIDSRQGAAVSGATVQIGAQSALTGDSTNGTTQGVYTILGVTPGSVYAVVRATGFQTLVTGITVEKGVNIKDFTLTADTTNTSVRGTLVGTAINSLGKLTSGVQVTVGAYTEDPREFRDETGDDGWYTIRDIPAGTYVVTARMLGETTEADIVQTVTIQSGVNTLNLVFGGGN